MDNSFPKKTLMRTARAALRSLVTDGEVVHDLNERGLGLSLSNGSMLIGLGHSEADRGGRARAALGLLAGGLLALELALGLGAVGGLDALVVADELFANGGALGLGSLAGGVATGRLADRLALGAALALTMVLGAANGAGGLLAVDGALGATRLFALHLALGALAHRVALSGAGRVVTLPLAGGVALREREERE